MGFAIRIVAFYDCDDTTYFVQGANLEEAKERAYKRFKETTRYCVPQTLKEAESENSDVFIEVLATIEQIIL